jgi:hypothetical protein
MKSQKTSVNGRPSFIALSWVIPWIAVESSPIVKLSGLMIASNVLMRRPLCEKRAALRLTARQPSKFDRVSFVTLVFRLPFGSPEVSKSKAM